MTCNWCRGLATSKFLVATACAVLFGLAVLPLAQAGGSVTFKEVRGIMAEPALRHLESAYSVSEIGVGVRLGRHYTHLGGARVAPYKFQATAKSNPNLNVAITIHAEVEFVDASGASTEDPKLAVDVSEKFQGYIIALDLVGPGVTDMPPSIPAPVAIPLSDSERQKVVADVRAIYAEVEAAELEFDGGQAEMDGISVELVRGYSRDGTVRRVEVSIGAGDHGGYGLEIQCDQQAIPRFVLWQEMYWQFKPGDQGQTTDHFTERRFYFSAAGQLAKALEKDYQGRDEADLERKRDAAKNRDFAAKRPGIAPFFAAAKKIINCTDAELVAVVQELIDGQRQMVGEN